MAYDPSKYQRNREAVLATAKRYYIRNREKLLAKQKIYDDTHRAQIARRFKEMNFYANNRPSRLEVAQEATPAAI